MLARINKRFPVFFDDFVGRDYLPGVFSGDHYKSLPAVNIAENDDSYVIEVAAPGLEKKDFSVSLENDCLTISSEKENKSEESNERYTRKEFMYHSFRRSFTLPDTVNSDKIKASHKNGILYVTVPKKDEAVVKPARQIEVA
jgi:HSP20 family protein